MEPYPGEVHKAKMLLVSKWPREWDSNPWGGYEPPHKISSLGPYVHLGTSRYMAAGAGFEPARMQESGH